MDDYVSDLQKENFMIHLQSLVCALLFGLKLQFFAQMFIVGIQGKFSSFVRPNFLEMIHLPHKLMIPIYVGQSSKTVMHYLAIFNKDLSGVVFVSYVS